MYVDPSGNFIAGLSMSTSIMGILAVGGGITSLGILNSRGESSSGSIWSSIINYEFRLLNVEIYIATVLMAGILPEKRTPEQQKDSDYDYGDYKNYCSNGPNCRDYPDDCSCWVAKIVHARTCIQKIEDFDEQWTDNRHGEKSLLTWKTRLKNLQERVDKICKGKK